MSSDAPWRTRARSRVAEIQDGLAMLWSDKAVVRMVVFATMVMITTFLARAYISCLHASLIALMTALALSFEMVNTIVEMVVDRIGLEPNALSAHTKHAAATLSLPWGLAAFVLWVVGMAGALIGVAMGPPSPPSPPRTFASRHITNPSRWPMRRRRKRWWRVVDHARSTWPDGLHRNALAQ